MAPTHPGLVEVVYGKGDFASKLVSLVDLNPGEVLTKIEGATSTSQRAYSSVQTGEHSDIELNSDLVFSNHSCQPTVVFDMAKFEIRAGEHGLKKGQDVTFFYPSSEWDMQQPFRCNCGSEQCLESIRGARFLEDKVLERYWLNEHIQTLLQKRRDAGDVPSNGGSAVDSGVSVGGDA
ncbi:Hypothetical protein R9X50_00130700 [Acrodontium crateriforme]|uniref:Post-SET domain-containing protein n=1 Tax=Acrodontium crateriforme TaxID=150365 RepID=A0AAQ3M4X9_9PEZI|nr:Hypothetical protein R9X50_00130700 [Acrodontium crateriforme]